MSASPVQIFFNLVDYDKFGLDRIGLWNFHSTLTTKFPTLKIIIEANEEQNGDLSRQWRIQEFAND